MTPLPRPDFHDPSIKAVSFDVFDTLIQRTVARPLEVFSLLEPFVTRLAGGRLDNFQEIRDLAERLTRLRRRESLGLPMYVRPEKIGQRDFQGPPPVLEEVSLDEIYQLFVDLDLLSPAQAEIVKAEDLATEARVMIRREAGIELLTEARAAGKRILLISDMYLPEAGLAEILQRLAIPAWDAFYLSSTHRFMKYYGGLFELVLEREGLQPAELFHVGDNEWSDVEVPGRLGIRSFHLPKASEVYKRHPQVKCLYPKGFPDSTLPNSPLFPALIQGLVQTRFFSNPFQPVPADSLFGGDLFHLGYAALGPAAAGFALWLAREAAADQVEDLFFLARDGLLLKQVFEILAPQAAPGQRIHYLLNSRRAVLAAGFRNSADILAAVMGYFQPVDLGRWLNDKFGLEPAEVPANVLKARRISSDQPVTMRDRDLLMPLALELAPIIYEKSAARRSLWRVYLEQTGFLRARHKAVVDIGFSGVIQSGLAKLCDETIPRGYYYISDYRAGRPVGGGLGLKSFFEAFADPFSGQFAHKYLYHCHFETFFKDGREAALDDLALGPDGLIRPVLRPRGAAVHGRAEGSDGVSAPPSSSINQKIAARIFEGAEAFARDLAEHFGPALKTLTVNAHSAAQAYLHFLERPTARDAALLRGLTVDDSVNGVDQKYFLAPEGGDLAASAWAEGANMLGGLK